MTAAYIDSSVLLRVLLDEPDPLPEFDQIKIGAANILIKMECLRTIDRIKFENQISANEYLDFRQRFLKGFRKLNLIAMSPMVIEGACQSWGVPLKSLDSIHLSSALLWQKDLGKNIIFCTHDKRLGEVAKANGLEVLGV
jgi:predicted nucleic acid-binding protein